MATNVLLTIDTEASPKTSGWRISGLADEIRWDIYGETRRGAYGVRYQMDVLEQHGLKGIFFVESLSACEVAAERLRELVELIQGRGHDVQLHIHTEWLWRMETPVLPGRTGKNMKDFSEDEQAYLIGRALENLRAAGARNVCAFRAGNYGANFDTLRALKRNGLTYDSSYNYPYLDRQQCALRTPEPLLQPQPLEEIIEYPIAFFRDYPGHYRHLQLTACSYLEMRRVFVQAWRRGWHSVVLVSHSFELLSRRSAGKPVLPDPVAIKRFERLCRFLGKNRDRFRTVTFSELAADPAPAPAREAPLDGTPVLTAARIAEQAARSLRQRLYRGGDHGDPPYEAIP